MPRARSFPTPFSGGRRNLLLHDAGGVPSGEIEMDYCARALQSNARVQEEGTNDGANRGANGVDNYKYLVLLFHNAE